MSALPGAHISSADSHYLNRLRGFSIMRVVFGHLGLAWFFQPFSSYIGIFLSILFLCSGYLSISFYIKRQSWFSYLARRLTGILVPFYIMYGFAVLVILL